MGSLSPPLFSALSPVAALIFPYGKFSDVRMAAALAHPVVLSLLPQEWKMSACSRW